MNELSQKIDEIAPEGRRNRHSFFQLQYFVIGKEPTVQARIQTCKGELISRKDEIESFMTMLEEAYDQYRVYEFNIEQIKGERHPDQIEEMDQLNIRKLRRQMKVLDYQIEDFKAKMRAKEDEANFLIGLYEKLCEIEEPKDWDSLEVQSEYWNAKLTREIETQLLLGNKPDAETLKSVFVLPSGMPIKEITNGLIRKGEELFAKQEKLSDDLHREKEETDGGSTEQLG